MIKAPLSCYLFFPEIGNKRVITHACQISVYIMQCLQMNYLMIKTSNSSVPLIKVWRRSLLRKVQQGHFMSVV